MPTALVPADHSSISGRILKSRGIDARCASPSRTMPERSTRGHHARFVSNKPRGPDRAAGKVKLDCGKDTNWLLFDPNDLQRFAHQKGGIMKKTIVTLACLLVAPLAFAQTSSTHKRQTTTEPITVTGTIIKMTTEDGAAASYQPHKTLVVREDKSSSPGRYVLN